MKIWLVNILITSNKLSRNALRSVTEKRPTYQTEWGERKLMKKRNVNITMTDKQFHNAVSENLFGYTLSCLNFAEETQDMYGLGRENSGYHLSAGYGDWHDSCDGQIPTRSAGLDVSWAFHESPEYIIAHADEEFLEEIISRLTLIYDDEWEEDTVRDNLSALIDEEARCSSSWKKEDIQAAFKTYISPCLPKSATEFFDQYSQWLGACRRLSRDEVKKIDGLWSEKHLLYSLLAIINDFLTDKVLGIESLDDFRRFIENCVYN